MGRHCAECGNYCNSWDFSSNQWRKGNDARCRDCVGGGNNGHSHTPRFVCGVCQREFSNQNSLEMHMQVHRPKNVSCPICGDTRFKSGANAVQHVESGCCRGCRGKDNARRQIYDFARRQEVMRNFMSGVPLLENGGSGRQGVPEFPYHCKLCDKHFRHLSQLLQHQDQKHGNSRLLIIY